MGTKYKYRVSFLYKFFSFYSWEKASFIIYGDNIEDALTKAKQSLKDGFYTYYKIASIKRVG